MLTEKITADNPEATDQWFVQAQPAADILPELFGDAVAAEMLTPKKRDYPVSQQTKSSPFDVRSIQLSITQNDILEAINESRAKY